MSVLSCITLHHVETTTPEVYLLCYVARNDYFDHTKRKRSTSRISYLNNLPLRLLQEKSNENHALVENRNNHKDHICQG